MKHMEIEYKYIANNIKLEDFEAAVDNLPIKKRLVVSSYDDYYVNKDGGFVRHRHENARGELNSSAGELTIKKKTCADNNCVRVEVNLPLSPSSSETVIAFLDLLGYTHSSTIYKVCHIMYLEKVDVVYYTVYDGTQINELGRFIEIEALEDADWIDENEALTAVNQVESLLPQLGLSPQTRLMKSMFELFVKTV